MTESNRTHRLTAERESNIRSKYFCRDLAHEDLLAEIDALRYQLRESNLRTYDGLVQERDRLREALEQCRIYSECHDELIMTIDKALGIDGSLAQAARDCSDCKGCPDCKGVVWKGPGD